MSGCVGKWDDSALDSAGRLRLRGARGRGRGECALAMNYDSKPYVYSPIYSYSQKGLVEGVSRGGLVGCGEVGLVEGLVTIDR